MIPAIALQGFILMLYVLVRHHQGAISIASCCF